MSQLIDALARELDEKFGSQTFLTLNQLQEINFFGSPAAARQALKSGLLPYVKVSERRFLIPREQFLKFVANNLRTR